MTERTRAKVTTGAAMTAVLVLGALQGSSASAEPDNTSTVAESAAAAATECVGEQPVGSLPGPGTGVPDGTPLFRVMAYADRTTAQARYDTVFTGLALDEENKAVDVYRMPSTASSQALDTRICAAAEKGVTVRLHDTPISEKDLSALMDRINADMDRWEGTFQVRQAGPDVEGYVVMGVDDPVKAEPVIKKAYGEQAKYIKVRHAEQAQPFTTK
ncbi:hypothetical protein [Streptomyces cavernae]|uniref:hypothetical protein n=1 Tax=Streptomyces cavernae TaxID=2259034 RepID=UPI000FEBBE42|nr:hypothetical protein [Streptomyces cavernae]